MGKVVDLQEYREGRAEKAEQRVYEIIEEDLANYQRALDIIADLPEPLQVQSVRVCVGCFVPLRNLNKKFE